MIRREAPAHPSGGTSATPRSLPQGCDDGSARASECGRSGACHSDVADEREGTGARKLEEGPRRGTKPKEEQDDSRPATVAGRNQTSQRSKASKSRSLPNGHRNLEPATEPGRDGEAGGDDGKGATATAMWCGCGAGDSSKGVNNVVRSASHHETRRTSQLAAGCNKPATSGRRKPSGWCETTRMERDFWRGISGNRSAQRCTREWTPDRVGTGEFRRRRWKEGPRDRARNGRQHALEESQDPRVRTIRRFARSNESA